MSCKFSGVDFLNADNSLSLEIIFEGRIGSPVTDDGASLVWTGGEYLYALRGEWHETIPNGDFARYHIPTQTWQNMTLMPESDGVGDGASLLWTHPPTPFYTSCR